MNVSFAQDDDSNAYRGLKFSAQPKHQSEIGVHVGHFMVIGDILPRPGWGAGLHFRRALDYAWSIRLDAMYGQGTGLEPRNSGGPGSGVANNRVLNGTVHDNIDYTDAEWYHNYQVKYTSLTLQGIWSLNSFNFKKQIRKWNWYVLAGVGADQYKTYYDALNSDGREYDFGAIANDRSLETSRSDRRDARKDLKDMLDGDYETRAETATGRRSDSGGDENLFDELQINGHANAGAGVAYKINDKINIGIEHQVTIIFGNEGDLVDGLSLENS